MEPHTRHRSHRSSLAGLIALAVVLAACAALDGDTAAGGGVAGGAQPASRPQSTPAQSEAAYPTAAATEIAAAVDATGPTSEPLVVDTEPTLGPGPLLPSQDPPAPVKAGYLPAGFGVLADVPFTRPVNCGRYSCQIRMDIYVPAGRGPFPILVLVRGGPGGLGARVYLNSFAADLATRGIMVFNADYRDVAGDGGGYPTAFGDVACAVRFARSQAGRYSGAGPVTLAGHSLGGWVGSVVALNPAEFAGSCLADGSGRPDAFVGLAGNYQLDAAEVRGDLFTFFGGSESATAKARTASDPFKYANGSRIPVRLVAGTADGTVNHAASVALNAFLLKKGWNVSLSLVGGANHTSILRTEESGGYSVRAIFSAMAAAASLAGAIDPVAAQGGH